MRAYHSLLLVILTVLLANCTATKPVPYTNPAAGSHDKETITSSLFTDKESTISELDIQRLLNGKIRLPDTVRVAVFKYGSSSISRYFSYWQSDEEYLRTQQAFVDELIDKVGQSSKVKKVIPVPSLMVTAKPTMTQLRETAVRLQADVLIVYSMTSDIYYKYRLFKKSEAKAFATTETILMDTRTGVIPHSSVITRDKIVMKTQEDLSDEETRKNAEREAIMATLTETGNRIAQFLDKK
ncbi:MAG: hypothetical protein ACK5RG_04385 [Cyclobacteriaceae bacterium]|jgi:hypothetical protein|nr:hypothetical protein [Flammeovirgaceae bacterium]